MGPVLLTVSAELQESIVTNEPRIPELTLPAPPQGDPAAVREAARLLVGAQSPLIQIAKVGRTPKGWDLLIELAEALQAPVDVMGYCVVAEVSVMACALWHRRPRLHAGRHARPRSDRHVGAGARGAGQQPQNDQHLCRAPLPGQQHSRLRALCRRGPRDRRRRRSDAAGAHRRDPPADHTASKTALAGARRTEWLRRTRRSSSPELVTRATAGTRAR